VNNKAKIFIATQGRCLLTDNRGTDLKLGADKVNQPTKISRILLGIAHAYIKETGSDDSDYWMSFVFDVCASLGLCSEQYISHLNSEQKKDYILQSFSHAREGNSEESIGVKEVAVLIREYVTQSLSPSRQEEHAIKARVDATLAFAHNLTSIDRSIEKCEEKFFIELRKEIYTQMGWRQWERVSLSASQQSTNATIESTTSNTKNSPTRLEDVVNEINSLVGLQSIKAEVQSLVNTLQVQRLRAQAGLPDIDQSNHMVFLGNPGTGKTTIARKLGDIYRHLGILSSGHFVETDRAALVGGYLGQTALKTTEVLNSALGGILFIDEAYSLSHAQNQDPYGQEAIDTILKYMEDNRKNLVVIVAGYQDLMREFLQSNPGLRSRFNKYFSFEDYGQDELAKIFFLMADKGRYFITPDAGVHLRALLAEMVENKSKNFGNGRTIRNFFEKTISNQAGRIVRHGHTEKIDLMRIEVSDIRHGDMIETNR
jgi:SpoVK/Ycf46/Vps4 family AAA+-type ATPase